MASTSPSTVSMVNASAKVKQVNPGRIGQGRAGPGIVVVVVPTLALALTPPANGRRHWRWLVLFMALARAPFSQCRLFVKFIK